MARSVVIFTCIHAYDNCILAILDLSLLCERNLHSDQRVRDPVVRAYDPESAPVVTKTWPYGDREVPQWDAA